MNSEIIGKNVCMIVRDVKGDQGLHVATFSGKFVDLVSRCFNHLRNG